MKTADVLELNNEMQNDKIPVPLQALTGTFVPAFFLAGFLVVRAIVTVWEPESALSRNATRLLIPVLLVSIGSIVQYRFLKRAKVVGMMDSAASPLAVTLLTVIGTVLSVAIESYLPFEGPGPRTVWTNRNPIQFGTFVILLVIWLSACAGVMVRRRTSPAAESGQE